MKKRKLLIIGIKLFLILNIVVALSLVKTNILVSADNGAYYRTYTVDASNELIPTQDAYVAVTNINAIELTNSSNYELSGPSDIYYNEANKLFYIADSNNKRIVVATKDFSSGYEVGSDILVKPQGVYANDEGYIYVADYGLKAVVIFNPIDLENPRIITKPSHPVYMESSSEFLPTKIVADSVGTMYIVDSGNANGLVTLTSDGEFSGYFGANYVQPDFAFVVKFIFSTKEQRKKLYVSPIAPINLAIDDDGLINTISNSQGSAIKKLNIAGTNLLPTNMWDWNNNADIAIGPSGTIYCINKYGYITEYDREGNLLFDFGGSDSTGTYVGLFKSPTSIEVDEDYSLYVLDDNKIQVFYQTEFAGLIHEALSLYNDGKYEESRVPWEKVLKLNNMFDLAHRGLGNAYLREGNYELALKEFKLAKDTASYSNAYWEVRNAWLNSTGYIVIIALIGVIIVFLILNKLRVFNKLKEKIRLLKAKIIKIKIIREFFYLPKFIRHPLNGFYEIKKANAMSVKSATIWYVWLFILTILSHYFTGFVFNPGDVERLTLVNMLTETLVPVLLFVIANYLISSITNGSGKLKDVYIGTICSLAPVLLFMPIVIILSNFIVETESFFYTVPKMFLWGWSFVLMYFMVKDIEELQIGENNKNIILTILSMLLFVAFAFLMYILSKQFIDFILKIIREVISRV